MKDIIITAQRQKRELKIFSACFLLAFLLNVISIILFDTQWIELISHIGYVTVLAFFIYFFILFIRLLILGIGKLIFKKRK